MEARLKNDFEEHMVLVHQTTALTQQGNGLRQYPLQPDDLPGLFLQSAGGYSMSNHRMTIICHG